MRDSCRSRSHAQKGKPSEGGSRATSRAKLALVFIAGILVLLAPFLVWPLGRGAIAGRGPATPGSATLSKQPQTADLFLGAGEITIAEEVAGVTADEGLGAFSFTFLFSSQIVDVSVSEGPFLKSTGRSTFCISWPFEGGVQFSCASTGPPSQPGPVGSGVLAFIAVEPKAGLSLRPTLGNGAVAVLDDLLADASLSDVLGEPIAVTEAGDAYVTVRALEGDLNQDCLVNVIDEQSISYRFQAIFGVSLYDRLYDLEPSLQPDGDIDIKDLQFVYGRDGTACEGGVGPTPPACTPPFTRIVPGDTDCDGAPDVAESGTDPLTCGTHNAADPWDLYDVPVPTIHSGGDMNNRDSAVTLFNDLLAVLEYSGTSGSFPCNSGPDSIPGSPDDRCYNHDKDGDGVDDGVAYDRSISLTGPWTGPPDGAIAILTDVLLVLAQTPHDCRTSP